MKKAFLPYYLSRIIISFLFAFAVWGGITWQATLTALFFIGLFLLYLHSGWFRVDLTYPLFPLRRDQRAELVQRKAMVASLTVGIVFALELPSLFGVTDLALSTKNLAIPLAIIAYFSVQFFLLSKAR